jgi:hypothetical protein
VIASFGRVWTLSLSPFLFGIVLFCFHLKMERKEKREIFLTADCRDGQKLSLAIKTDGQEHKHIDKQLQQLGQGLSGQTSGC